MKTTSSIVFTLILTCYLQCQAQDSWDDTCELDNILASYDAFTPTTPEKPEKEMDPKEGDDLLDVIMKDCDGLGITAPTTPEKPENKRPAETDGREGKRPKTAPDHIHTQVLVEGLLQKVSQDSIFPFAFDLREVIIKKNKERHTDKPETTISLEEVKAVIEKIAPDLRSEGVKLLIGFITDHPALDNPIDAIGKILHSLCFGVVQINIPYQTRLATYNWTKTLFTKSMGVDDKAYLLSHMYCYSLWGKHTFENLEDIASVYSPFCSENGGMCIVQQSLCDNYLTLMPHDYTFLGPIMRILTKAKLSLPALAKIITMLKLMDPIHYADPAVGMPIVLAKPKRIYCKSSLISYEDLVVCTTGSEIVSWLNEIARIAIDSRVADKKAAIARSFLAIAKSRSDS